MTNIDSVLRSYFVDVEINEIIHSMNSVTEAPLDEGLPSSKFKDLFLKHNSKYGLDIIGSIHNMAMDFWLSDDSNPYSKSVFNILHSATKNILVWDNDEPVCHFGEYLRWNELTSIVGEDLLTTAFLAKRQQSCCSVVEPKSFAWKPYISQHNINLSHMMEKGLHELHFHLNGSSLVISLNWLSIMNQKKGNLNNVIKDFNEEFVLNTLKAKYIRYFLFEVMKNQQGALISNLFKHLMNVIQANSIRDLLIYANPIDSKIQTALQKSLNFNQNHFSKENFIDYALTAPLSELDLKRYYNIPLIGERKFLYNALTRIYECDKNFQPYKTLFYIYLVSKNQFRRKIIQNDNIKGFEHFQNIQEKKDYFVKENRLYKSLYTYMAIQNTIGNQPIRSLEIRIAPKDSTKKIIELLKNINDNINDECFRFGEKNILQEKNIKIGYIIHFIKTYETKGKFHGCRNGSIRNLIKKQADAIATLIRKNSMYVKGGIVPKRKNNFQNNIFKIIGIDAANSEFCCRPEVFAPIFRYLKNIKRNSTLDYLYEKHELNLGRTFHVGEDFYDIIDGLRAIDECVKFMNFGEGDRLGHAVALGINAYDYYKTRNFRIVLPSQILLDNVVWLYKKIQLYSIPDANGLLERLNRAFLTYTNFIFAQEIESISIDEYYQSWLLRGDDPNAYNFSNIANVKPYYLNQMDDNLDIIRKNNKIKSILKSYLFNENVYKKGNVCVEFNFENNDTEIIEDLQKKMVQDICAKKISIECNLTSNLRITDVERYAKHPITKFNNYKLLDDPNSDQIEVSINTDDQGVFATSLEKEYTLIAEALEKKRDENGNIEYSAQKIYDWLDSIRESARKSSFLRDIN